MRVSLIFFSLIPAMGQFSGLAATDDGSQLYFSSSLQLAGTTNENTYSKIFRDDSTGIHFVAQMARVATARGIMLPNSNPYNLTGAYVSGSGSVSGYVGTADCPHGPCYYQGFSKPHCNSPDRSRHLCFLTAARSARTPGTRCASREGASRIFSNTPCLISLAIRRQFMRPRAAS
jgi:hypothetical protein